MNVNETVVLSLFKIKAEISLPLVSELALPFLFCLPCQSCIPLYGGLGRHIVESNGTLVIYFNDQSVLQCTGGVGWANKALVSSSCLQTFKICQTCISKSIYCAFFLFISCIGNGTRNSASAFVSCNTDQNQENNFPVS